MTAPVLVTTRRAAADGQTVTRQFVWCPGCDCAHAFITDPPAEAWTWNGDRAAPTFSPSLLVTYDDAGTRRCHSYLTGGRWQFLDDSTAHQLRGDVAMVPVPDWLLAEADR